MADEEQAKRRRGRRRGRGGGGGGGDAERPAGASGEQVPGQQPPEPGAPLGGVVPPTGPISSSSEQETRAAASGPTRRERRAPTAGGSQDVSPMDFWRSGRARSHRERYTGQSGGGGPRGIWNRIRHMYFPPWVPVAAIIVVVFGILGLLFVTRSATGAPRIGRDHWHATYTFYACGDKQPNAPTWESGVHTHGDGVVHIHPFTAAEEGAGARLVRWFEYGGGELSDDSIRLPGLSKTWENGETCPDTSTDAGQTGEVQVFVNSVKLDDWSRYIPKDGDRIRLIFGPPEDFVQLDDRIVLPEEQATREVEITVTGDDTKGEPNAFEPSTIQVKSGETVKLIVTNASEGASHGLRIAGSDGEYGTGDDFVVVPEGSDPTTADQGDVLEPGARGFAVVRLDEAGQVAFQDPTATEATGNIIVSAATSPTPQATGAAAIEVDQEADLVTMKDGAFEPESVTLEADKSFRIPLKNDGELAHNMRIAGEDGEFETDDDIVSDDVPPGAEGAAVLAEGGLPPGSYDFRDDFNPTRMTGTLVIE